MKYLVLTCLKVVLIAGCASAPPPKPAPAPREIAVLSIVRLEACDKPYAYFVVTTDGVIHEAPAEDMSKAQIAGLDNAAEGLPDGNAGSMAIPCVPSQKTSLQD